MKLIKAYVREFMVSRVLNELKAPRMTVVAVKALGDEIPHKKLQISAKLGSSYTTMMKIEMICNDQCIKRIKNTILRTARTGYKGDGLITISPIEEAVSKGRVKGQLRDKIW